jgi:Skp family chaperone for outer membrane proteins
MKKTTLLAAVALLALTAPAFAQTAAPAADVKTDTKVETSTNQKANGGYEEKRNVKTDSKDEAGTETTESSKAKVEVDQNGNGSKTVETKSTVDPKGLMNEKSTKTTLKEEVKDGKKKVHRVKKVNGKTTVDETTNTTVDTQPAQ